MRPPLQRVSSLKNVELAPDGSERAAQKAIHASQKMSLDVQAPVSRHVRSSPNAATRCPYLGPARLSLSEPSGLWPDKRGHILAIAPRTSLMSRLLTATHTFRCGSQISQVRSRLSMMELTACVLMGSSL